MYAAVITTLVALGLIISAIYISTWGLGAVKARYYRITTLTPWEIVDFAALPAACLIILTLNVINIAEGGILPAPTVAVAIQRIGTIVFIDAIVLLRLIRWSRKYFSTPKEDRSFGAAMAHRQDEDAS